MNRGDHVRIRLAKLPEAVGALGRIIDCNNGQVRLTPPLLLSTGATVCSIWCRLGDLEVVEPTARFHRIAQEVDHLASMFLYYDRKEDEHLPVGSIQEAILSGEVTVDEIVDRLRGALSASVDRAKVQR